MDLSDCDYHHNKLELYRKRLGDARKMHIETEKAIKRLEEEIIRKCNNIQRSDNQLSDDDALSFSVADNELHNQDSMYL